MRELEGKVAVITGTSRGIGAELSKALASEGAEILGNHVDPSKQKRADRIEQKVENLGSKMRMALADITEPEGREALFQESQVYYPDGVDYLVLNAAGGLEEGKGPGWAEKINIESQLSLVEKFLPVMKPGGEVVYLTSLWAHKYGEVKQLPSYEPVARTKHAAEKALREMIPDLEERGIRLAILCGHVIKGTAAHTLFTRAFKEEMTKMEELAEGGKFPEASDMGKALVNILTTPHPSGSIYFVGGTGAEPIDEREKLPYTLNREQIAEKLPMYGDDKLYVNEFHSPEDKQTGIGKYIVRDQDVRGHFKEEFGIQLFRGVDEVEAAAQTVGLTSLSAEPSLNLMPFFRGFRVESFDQMIFPGDEVTMYAKLLHRSATGIIGECEVKVGEKTAAVVTDIKVDLVPREIALRIIRKQKASRG